MTVKVTRWRQVKWSKEWYGRGRGRGQPSGGEQKCGHCDVRDREKTLYYFLKVHFPEKKSFIKSYFGGNTTCFGWFFFNAHSWTTHNHFLHITTMNIVENETWHFWCEYCINMSNVWIHSWHATPSSSVLQVCCSFIITTNFYSWSYVVRSLSFPD